MDWSDGDGSEESAADANWYAFVIQPSGAGYNVSFNKAGEVKQADQVFICKQRS